MKGISSKPRQSARKAGKAHFCPDAGDFVWLQFDPQAGHEQAGHRPALVLSSRAYNTATGLCIACPVTSRVRGYPFEVLLPDGLSITGAVLSDHMKSVDWVAREAQLIAKSPHGVLAEVRGKLAALLQLA
jgi:mRNA interferase MazF